ncbi:NAD(P)H-dependent oxidoreductase [Salirhabdus salicampi]|uniref:NAD(P)H-dependent oxidoreductase n=1 Tax=Salirhabdus salicampi TaxID=476102 RepID=UPI0020C257C3|nr:NAD(P)H-dependent oxidoreductase [Salirhabdus salicampi]MCP8617260.1 NAD(P)H-dependent oxidoreductase [Salirhabdus salicampi]
MKVLVIVVHPSLQDSRLNAALKSAIDHEPNITVHDLYSTYPREQINVKKEQQLLEEHDRIVFQFPNYWYSYPPLLKKWFDEVLERGWAFKEGFALRGKELGVAISSAFTPEEYRFDGLHRFTIEQILAPFYATCNFIRAKTIPIFKTFEESIDTTEELIEHANKYVQHLKAPYSFHYNSY